LRSKITINYRKQLLQNLENEFENEEFKDQAKGGQKKLFSRNRCFTLKKLIVIIMLLKTSYQREIERFGKLILKGDYNIRLATKGALSQARAKLNPVAFRRLSEVAVNSFYDGAPYCTWQGLRVLAVDGSSLKLPNSKEIKDHFGSYDTGRNGSKEVCMAKCSLLYDVLNHVTVDSQLGLCKESEKSLFIKHFEYLKQGDLILGDRNYPSMETMYRLTKMNVDFCFRMKEDWWLIVKEFKKSGENEQIVKIIMPTKVVTKFEIKEEDKEITCRLIRIELENGQTEILCTSLLDPKIYEYDQFQALYHARWNVEEAYKLLKSRIQIEGFTGRTTRSIYQDFYAKIFMMTLCATLSYPIEIKVRQEYKKELTQNKYDQQINRTSAIAQIKDNLVNLLIKKTHKKTIAIMDALIEKTKEIVRPNRKVPIKHLAKKRYHSNYKPI